MQNLQYVKSCHTFRIEFPVEVLAMKQHWCFPCRHTPPTLVTKYLKEMSWTRRHLTNHNHCQFCNLKPKNVFGTKCTICILLTKSCIWRQIRGENDTMNVFFPFFMAPINEHLFSALDWILKVCWICPIVNNTSYSAGCGWTKCCPCSNKSLTITF